MIIENDTVTFSTGRQVYANGGIIGLAPNLEVTEGYDGDIAFEQFSSEECIELAEYMIGQWQRFLEIEKSQL